MTRISLLAVLGGVTFVAATPCAAGEPMPSLAPSRAAIQTDGQKALSDNELDALRGGDGNTTIISSQTLNAVTSGNAINGGFTAGDVSISDSALSNFNGIANIIINTGAQVSLQTGMNVTINTSN